MGAHAHAQGSGDAGQEMNDAGAGNDAGGGGGGGSVAMEEVVEVRHVDAVDGGQVGGLSEVIDEDEGSVLQRVGELVDELLGDELVHPYTNLRKNLKRKASVHGGAPFSTPSVCKSLLTEYPSFLRKFTLVLKGVKALWQDFDDPYFELFIWATLLNRKELALYFLEHSRVCSSHIDKNSHLLLSEPQIRVYELTSISL